MGRLISLKHSNQNALQPTQQRTTCKYKTLFPNVVELSEFIRVGGLQWYRIQLFFNKVLGRCISVQAYIFLYVYIHLGFYKTGFSQDEVLTHSRSLLSQIQTLLEELIHFQYKHAKMPVKYHHLAPIYTLQKPIMVEMQRNMGRSYLPCE